MTQLCITVPAIAAPGGVSLLSEALSATRLAAVVIMPAAGEAIAPDAALPIIAAAQKAGAAALIYADPQLARTLKADGVHLPWSVDVRSAVEEARDILGQAGIIGAEAGASRHDAMELGELGVDYVAFGLTASPDKEAARADRNEFVAWWAEIFEVPGVALDVTQAGEAAMLASTGIDFLNISLTPGSDAGKLLSAISAAIAATSAAPAA